MSCGRHLAIASLCLFFFVDSHATTIAEECKNRAMRAYDGGSTDQEKAQLAQIEANICFKEMEAALRRTGTSLDSEPSAGPAPPKSRIEPASAAIDSSASTPQTSNGTAALALALFMALLVACGVWVFALRPRAGKDSTATDVPTVEGAPSESRRTFPSKYLEVVRASLAADIEVRDQILELFKAPPADEADLEELQLRERLREKLATTLSSIEEKQGILSSTRLK
jgi:hypothetical protein